VAGAIIAKYPAATADRASSGHVTVGGVAALTVLLSVVEIALWLGIARACRNGRSGARATGTVLFGLHTLGFLGVLVNPHPGIGLTKVLTALNWLIACGAVVFLWQRPSSAFLQAAGAPGRRA
jgi:hypothetical protein